MPGNHSGYNASLRFKMHCNLLKNILNLKFFRNIYSINHLINKSFSLIALFHLVRLNDPNRVHLDEFPLD